MGRGAKPALGTADEASASTYLQGLDAWEPPQGRMLLRPKGTCIGTIPAVRWVLNHEDPTSIMDSLAEMARALS